MAVRPSLSINFEHFVTVHFALPFLVFGVAFMVLETTDVDYWISREFYDAGLQIWPYRDAWITEQLIHRGGKYFAEFIGVLILLSLLLSLRSKSILHPYRRLLSYLFIAGISGPIIVAVLKSHTHVYCPWDLELFGGTKPYIRFFDYVPPGMEVGRCFPAGHAAGGYSFVSLYFFLLLVNPRYKNHGLVAALVLGAVFGIAQQMRGAHFLSHDLFTLAVCWSVSLFLFIVLFRKNLQWI